MKSRIAKVGIVLLAIAAGYAPFATKGKSIPAMELRALERGEAYELVSLDPDPRKRVDQASTDGFHGWFVLGRTAIEDPDVRRKLNEALSNGVRNSGNMAAKCFNPRHAIRVTLGDEVIDFVICFECRQVAVFTGNSEAEWFLTSDLPQAVFDDVLKQAGVPLLPRSE
jgi:hypothetical protein